MASDKRWMVAVQGSKGMKYVVSFDLEATDGRKHKCTCKAFEHYYEEKGPCKHIQWVLEGKIQIPQFHPAAEKEGT
jgi:uncharacterized Zn finger protein